MILLYELKQSGVGCFWEDLFVGALVTHLEMMLPGGMAIVALEREGFLTICTKLSRINEHADCAISCSSLFRKL